MVARSDALVVVRDTILDTGRGYLRNTERAPRACRVCAGVVGPGFQMCAQCNQRRTSRGRPDRLGFVTYAVAGTQSGHMMRAYKTQPPSPQSAQLVESLLGYGIVAHWDCTRGDGSGHPEGWTYVPSLSSGRAGEHPIGALARPFLRTIPYVPLSASAATKVERHEIISDDFTVATPPPRHVLLLDDTWTSGRHVHAASASLKAAGAERVTVLCVARWLNPEFGHTTAFIESLPDDFDPDICPYTGAYC